MPARYLDIAEWLSGLASSSPPGTRLPSESEIAKKFAVSRMTVRSAMQHVENEGLIVRRQGAGTFTRDNPLHRHEGLLMSFTSDMERRGLRATSKLLRAELRPGSEAETKALALPDGHKVISIERVRYADEAPLALESATLPPDCVEVLAHDLESGSLHDALSSIGRAPVIAHSRISARAATPNESALLGTAPSEPLLVERRVVHDAKDAPFEFTETAYVASRYIIDAVFSAEGQERLTRGQRPSRQRGVSMSGAGPSRTAGAASAEG